jgi:hypothetical protein
MIFKQFLHLHPKDIFDKFYNFTGAMDQKKTRVQTKKAQQFVIQNIYYKSSTKYFLNIT